MAHREQQEYCTRIASRFPEHFGNPEARIFDGGSLDLNGNNRYLFASAFYTGVDIGPGRNVDIVSPIHEYWAKDGHFDIIVSTECLEHDQHWGKSLRNMFRMLRPGGFMLITCATTGRQEHGTTRTDPGSSPFTNDYYRNLTEEDFRSALPMDGFSECEFEVNTASCDLSFWGLKKA